MSKRVAALVLIMITVIGVNLGFVNWRLMSDRVRMNQINNQSYMRDMILLEGHKKQDMQIGQLGFDVPEVVDARRSSVVSIYTEHATLRDFQTGEPARMSAAGVVISKDGCILTAAHVVDDTDFSKYSRFWVVFADGTEREVKRIAHTVKRNPDVGLVWIDPEGLDLNPISVDDMEPVPVLGERVIVIGNPLGLSHSVTVGVVSRHAPMMDLYGVERKQIQIDAAINGGNSGGAAFNMEGKLLGILSWKKNAEGISFVVPINSVLSGIEQCREKARDVVLAGDNQ